MSSVSRSRTGHVVVISLAGEFDVANVEEVQANAQHAVAADGVTHVIVDLAEVTFLGSTGLGALIRLRTDAAHASISLVLRNVPAPVQRLLALTGLDTVFDLMVDEVVGEVPFDSTD
jgi:anti-anti-sigma factor